MQFKASMLNGWATKAFDSPETPNDFYHIAGAWVKPTAKIEGGTTATFVTIEEEARINKKHNDKFKRKKKEESSSSGSSSSSCNQRCSQGGETEAESPQRSLAHRMLQVQREGALFNVKGLPIVPGQQEKQSKGRIHQEYLG